MTNSSLFMSRIPYQATSAPSYRLRPSASSHPATRTLKDFPVSAAVLWKTISNTALTLCSVVKSADSPPRSVFTHYSCVSMIEVTSLGFWNDILRERWPGR